MEFPGQPASKDSTAKIVIAVAIVVAIGAVVWYFGAHRKKIPPPTAGLSNTPAAAPASTLGGTLYEKANNPIQNKLPATVAPVPNPIQGAYKNPFR